MSAEVHSRGAFFRSGRWSQADTDFMRKNVGRFSDAEIGKILGRSEGAVGSKRRREGILRRGEKGLRDQFQALKQFVVTIGIQGSDAGRRHDPNSPNVATIGLIHEFGTRKIPERSFLRAPLAAHRAEIKRAFTAAAATIVAGGDPVDAFATAGAAVARLVKNWLIRSPSWATPNAPSTVKAKGFDYPLHETGMLQNSITWAVRRARGMSIVRQGSPL